MDVGGTGVDVGGGLVGVLVLVGGFRVGTSVKGGVFVISGVRVFDGTRVAERKGVFVRVGKCVAVGDARKIAVWVNRLWVGTVVNVTKDVCEGTGVNVTLGVKDGVAEMRGVAVGVEEAVLVGAVWVGNGPSRACAVPANAVLMLLRSPPLPSVRPNTFVLPNVMNSAMKINARNKAACKFGFNEALFFLFTLVASFTMVFRDDVTRFAAASMHKRGENASHVLPNAKLQLTVEVIFKTEFGRKGYHEISY